MLLKLNQIDVECIIGDLPEERTRLQRLLVDVEMEVSDLAAETDELTDTVDYAALTEAIRSSLVAAQCRMIERAARVACETCFKVGGSAVFSAKVAVTKTGAIPHLASATAVYERSSS